MATSRVLLSALNTYICIYLTIARTYMGKNIGVKMVDLGFDHIVSRVINRPRIP